MDQIVRRARAGDRDAINDLCAHYHPILCRFFAGLLRTREGAEDLAQETMIAMLRGLPDYKALPGKRFEGYIMRIGYNKFLDFVRKKKDDALPEGYDPPGADDSAVDQMILSERAIVTRAAIAQLDKESQSMIIMRYELDMNYKDIAAALQILQPKVKWRLNDALNKLRRILKEGGFEWTT